MKDYIRQKNINKTKNGIHGSFIIGKEKLFFKVLNKRDYEYELQGYDILKNYYNVAKRYSIIDERENIIFYKYNNNVDCNKGLLVDYFAKHNHLNEEYKKILNIYYNVFKKTLNFGTKGNCRMFFEERLDTRLLNNVNSKYFYNFENTEYFFNRKKVIINNFKIYQSIIEYFTREKKSWNVISNADPNDMNICTDGMLFDYTAGGYVPLMCEFAVFVCYNLIQSEYLSIKYQKNIFEQHNRIYKHLRNISVLKNSVNFNARKIRVEAIKEYINKIVKPLLKNIDYKDWYNDFKNYCAMKLLAVYNFNEFAKKDVIFIIVLLNAIYNQDFDHIEEFESFIIDLCG